MEHIKKHWDCRAIASEVELHYMTETDPEDRMVITSPEDAVELLWDIFPKEKIELKEMFVVVLLNNSKQVLGYGITSVGGKTATIVEISEIVTIALLGSAHSIIVAHNHPSGTMRPSAADSNLTTRLIRALSYLGITLDDHFILGKNKFYSFVAHGEIRNGK